MECVCPPVGQWLAGLAGLTRVAPQFRRVVPLLVLGWSVAGCINWPMFRHDSRHTGQVQFNTASIKGVLKWKVQFAAGCRIESSPAVDDGGNVYIGAICGTDPDLRKLTGAFCRVNPNGKVAWCNINTQGYPVFSSAATAKAVYIGAFDSGVMGLLAIDRNNGGLIWNFPAPLLSSPPTLYVVLSGDRPDTTIYTGSFVGGTLFAIRPDGTEKWHFTIGNGDISAGINTSPAVAGDGTIYVGFSGHAVVGETPPGGLAAVNPNGTQKWIYGPTGGVDSSPAVGNDGTIYFGSYDRFFYAVNPNGSTKWTLANVGVVVSSPGLAPGGSAIYFGSRNHRIYSVAPNAFLNWSFSTGGEVDSSPAIGADGTVYVGSADRYLYALKPNGKLSWKFLAGGPIRSSPAVGEAGRTIYVGSEDGALYAIQ